SHRSGSDIGSALDPSRAQGFPICEGVCPQGWTAFHDGNTELCCSGTPNGATCNAEVCAVDPNANEGFPACNACGGGAFTLYGTHDGGFCCAGSVTNGVCSSSA